MMNIEVVNNSDINNTTKRVNIEDSSFQMSFYQSSNVHHQLFYGGFNIPSIVKIVNLVKILKEMEYIWSINLLLYNKYITTLND